jgi:hypothetical protein
LRPPMMRSKHPILFGRIAGFANLKNKKRAACAAEKR